MAEDSVQNDTTTKKAPSTNIASVSSRISRLKTAFLYVLMAALAAAAITSVIALLVGSINDALGKSLLTIFIFLGHSLIILGVLWADRDNHVGRYILPTTIIGLVFASMITTTLGTWELLEGDLPWRFQGLYFLILGAVFLITGALRLRLAHQALQVTIQTSVALIALTILAVSPWVLGVFESYDPLYYRIVSALTILATTSFLITLVFRGIVTGRGKEILATKPVTPAPNNRLLTIYILVGTIAAIVWFAGFVGFAISAAASDNSAKETTHSQQS